MEVTEPVGGVDWIEATIWSRTPGEVCADIGGSPDDWVETGGLLGYSSSYRSERGAKVLFTPDRQDVHLVLPGAWALSASQAGQRRALEYLQSVGAKFTRIDLQLTDETRTVEPREVWGALRRGEAVTHARRWRHMESGGDESGETVYVGAPSSKQHLTVYDKEAESHGRQPGVRWELCARGKAAESLAAQLLASANWGEVWAGRLVAFVEFCEVTGDANSARRPRCPWFSALVGSAEKMRAYPPVAPRTLDQVRGWVARQVAPSLALIVKADGGDTSVVRRLIALGGQRLSARHLAMLAAELRREDV